MLDDRLDDMLKYSRTPEVDASLIDLIFLVWSSDTWVLKYSSSCSSMVQHWLVTFQGRSDVLEDILCDKATECEDSPGDSVYLVNLAEGATFVVCCSREQTRIGLGFTNRFIRVLRLRVPRVFTSKRSSV